MSELQGTLFRLEGLVDGVDLQEVLLSWSTPTSLNRYVGHHLWWWWVGDRWFWLVSSTLGELHITQLVGDVLNNFGGSGGRLIG